jgi:hypothetical protein
VDVPSGSSYIANESQSCLKHGRKIGSNGKNPQIRNEAKKKDDPSEDMKISKEHLT